jgi:hypothetical protein
MTNRLEILSWGPFSARVGEPLDGGARQLNLSTLLADGSANFQTLLEEGERVFCRVGRHTGGEPLQRLLGVAVESAF